MKLTTKQKRIIANVICNDTELSDSADFIATPKEINNLQEKLKEWL